MRYWLIQQLTKNLNNKDRMKILSQVVKDNFSVLNEDDIFRETEDGFTYKGKKISVSLLRVLVSEASVLRSSKLWSVLKDEVRFKTGEVLIEESKSEVDLIAAKLWLYTIDNFDNLVEKLSGLNSVLSDDLS